MENFDSINLMKYLHLDLIKTQNYQILHLFFFPIISELLLKKGKINKGKAILLNLIFLNFSIFLI